MALDLITNRLADVSFAAKRFVVGRHRARRAQLYCVGTGKSGTHSIVSMFAKPVRAAHECEATLLMEKFLAWKSGALDQPRFTQWLLARDRRIALEVDSSTLNRDILDLLLRQFPCARFLLTIRDCYSWCDSFMNHRLRCQRKTHPLWRTMGHYRMRPEDFRHGREEQVLKEQGFAPLDCFLSYWTAHNAGVLERVPEDRLLVVRTDQIRQRAFDIADFAGLPRRAVRLDKTHAFKNPAKQPVLLQLDRHFLESKVDTHCRALMSRFFPEIKSIDDAALAF
jgi:hypothetical protein